MKVNVNVNGCEYGKLDWEEFESLFHQRGTLQPVIISGIFTSRQKLTEKSKGYLYETAVKEVTH